MSVAVNTFTNDTRAFIGNLTTFSYTGSDLTSSTDALGNVTNYAYTNGLVSAVSDALASYSRIARATGTTQSSVAGGPLSDRAKLLSVTVNGSDDLIGNVLRPESEVELRCGEVQLFKGQMGRRSGKIAVKISDRLMK